VPGQRKVIDHLRTERLLLRRWTDADRAPFAAMNADPRVMEHFPALMSREQSDRQVDRIEAGFAVHGFGLWAVEVDGRFAGFTGLSVPCFEAPFLPVVEVGWRLAAEFWGRGYATEAARASIADGFERVGLREILSFTATANLRSQRVMQRLGMTPDGTFEHPKLALGSPLRTHVLYRLSAGDGLTR
jgi:RimJ/RimL family protein N-acetyltransferase